MNTFDDHPNSEDLAQQELSALRAQGAMPSVDHLVATHVAAIVELSKEHPGEYAPLTNEAPGARSLPWFKRRFATVIIATAAVMIGTSGLALANVLPDPIQHNVEKVTRIIGIEPRHKEEVREAQFPKHEKKTATSSSSIGDPQPSVSTNDASPDGNMDQSGDLDDDVPTTATSGSDNPIDSDTAAPDEDASSTDDPIASPVFTRQPVAWNLQRVTDSGMTLQISYASVEDPCFRQGKVRIKETDHRVRITILQRIDEACTSPTITRVRTIHLPNNLGSRTLVDGTLGTVIKREFTTQTTAWTFNSLSHNELTVHLNYSSVPDACFRPGKARVREGRKRVTIIVTQRVDANCSGDAQSRSIDALLTEPLADRKLFDGSSDLEVQRGTIASDEPVQPLE